MYRQGLEKELCQLEDMMAEELGGLNEYEQDGFFMVLRITGSKQQKHFQTSMVFSTTGCLRVH